MMKRYFFLLLVFLQQMAYSQSDRFQNYKSEKQSLADYVDMHMGQKAESNCVIGPQLPHGSINPSPQTIGGENDGYAPGEPVMGFAQLHVSGTGWGRYGQILVSPQTGFNCIEGQHNSSISREAAKAYYYGVLLERYQIFAEVTPTHHCAIYRLTFPESDDANILVDVAHNIPQHIKPEIKGTFLGGEIFYDKDKNALKGWGNYAGGFGSEELYKVFFFMQIENGSGEVNIVNHGSEALYAQIRFHTTKSQEIRTKIGISMSSMNNAEKFLSDEIPDFDFESVVNKAKKAWDQTLASIKLEGASEDKMKVFYTSLYHSFLMARDRTNDNPWWSGNEPYMDDHYCIWDTWRTKYPLMVLIKESYVTKTINSFIDRYNHRNICRPTFTSGLEGPLKQGGDDVDNVIADAFVKKVKGVNWNEAYKLLKYNAENERSIDYLRLGWQPEVGGLMSCSNNLCYSYNDFCFAQVAKGMGKKEDYEKYLVRSGSWQNLFDINTNDAGYKGFIRPRAENGKWVDFETRKVYASWVEFFYESNSWTYSLFVPHALDKLIKISGGKNNMTERLKYGFEKKLILMDNEPGFLSPFVFIHSGRPDLTSCYVSDLRDKRFSLNLGYPGNEDSGAMGSWYVFASMGLFPNAGQDFYYLFGPAFPKITLTTESGKKIIIFANNISSDNKYIQSAKINGTSLNRAWIRHDEIMGGALIELEMGPEPSRKWGKTPLKN
ncbi:MAG: GH92 family glycosyl hydrolase [Bacteroidales bacterium]|nr:GH92 family glycosyl hydrolase [Bacteroidales bacterium]